MSCDPVADQAIVQDLTIRQGIPFGFIFLWMQRVKVYKPITAATLAAPCVITAVGHQLPDLWPYWVSGAQGLVRINSPRARQAKGLSVDTLELNDVNASGALAYAGGGIVSYFAPNDLNGYTGDCELRPSPDSSEVLLSLTSANSRIVLDNTLKRIRIDLDQPTTQGLNFDDAYYLLKAISASGRPYGIAKGQVRLIRQQAP